MIRVFMLFLFNHFLVDVLYLGGLADLLKFWRRSVDLFSGHVFLCVRCEPGQKTNREVCCFFLGVGAGKVKPFKDEALTMRTSNFQPCLLLGLAALHGVFFFFASLTDRGIVHCVYYSWLVRLYGIHQKTPMSCYGPLLSTTGSCATLL